MKFKRALIDMRFSRESGTGRNGVYLHGETLTSRYLKEILPGFPIIIAEYHPIYVRLDVNPNISDEIPDTQLFINSELAFTFAFNGTVTNDYNVVRFFFHGFYYIFEYRLLNRENIFE